MEKRRGCVKTRLLSFWRKEEYMKLFYAGMRSNMESLLEKYDVANSGKIPLGEMLGWRDLGLRNGWENEDLCSLLDEILAERGIGDQVL